HLHLGNCLLDKKDFDEALRELKFAIKLYRDRPRDPRERHWHALAHSNLADALKQKGDLKGAEGKWRAAIKLDPQLTEARVNLGNILSVKGDYRGAAQELQAVCRTDPRYPTAQYNLGLVFLAQGQFR